MICLLSSVSVLSSASSTLIPLIITYTITILIIIIIAAVGHTLSQCLVLVQSIDGEMNSPVTIALS